MDASFDALLLPVNALSLPEVSVDAEAVHFGHSEEDMKEAVAVALPLLNLRLVVCGVCPMPQSVLDELPTSPVHPNPIILYDRPVALRGVRAALGGAPFCLVRPGSTSSKAEGGPVHLAMMVADVSSVPSSNPEDALVCFALTKLRSAHGWAVIDSLANSLAESQDFEALTPTGVGELLRYTVPSLREGAGILLDALRIFHAGSGLFCSELLRLCDDGTTTGPVTPMVASDGNEAINPLAGLSIYDDLGTFRPWLAGYYQIACACFRAGLIQGILPDKMSNLREYRYNYVMGSTVRFGPLDEGCTEPRYSLRLEGTPLTVDFLFE